MKLIFALLVSVSLSYSQDSAKVPLRFMSDTTYYSFVVYRQDGVLHADSGYIIRSGLGSEFLANKYASDPKLEIFLSPKKKINIDDIWDLRLRGKNGSR